jgi:hypothetical protein
MAASATTRVCFLYIAQAHQILHSLPIAVALARGQPQIEVYVAATAQAQLDYIDAALKALGGAPIQQRLLGPAWLRAIRPHGASTPPKAAMLAANAVELGRYDAIVTPERTTALLRRLGVRHPLLVYTQHGTGDRGGPFEPRLRKFDLVMAAGPKLRDRLVGEGWVKPDDCAVVGYPKFDIVRAMAPEPKSPFPADGRPIVVYNPHFDPSLSSWPRWGLDVLRAFAASGAYNLIFAPHIRLFDGASPAELAALDPFRNHPRIHIDVGGPAAIDMTYTRLADLYLGDASSQIYEFLLTPRPAVFLNAHGVDWRGDESYRHWRYGPVLDSLDGLIGEIDDAQVGHADFIDEQRRSLAETFDLQERSSSDRAADAIVARLARAGR